MDKLLDKVKAILKEHVRIAIVEWYNDSFSIRIFWDDEILYESSASSGKLTN